MPACAKSARKIAASGNFNLGKIHQFTSSLQVFAVKI
jgi:hypothetical protein